MRPATVESFSGVETVNNTSWRWQQARTLRYLPTKLVIAVQVEKKPWVSRITNEVQAHLSMCQP